MTWASNVGELGVRDVLIEMEAELEGINQALNTPSALPGEVRMFVGMDNIPEGWEEVGLSVNSPFDNVWSVGPSLLRNGQSAWYGVDSGASAFLTHPVAMAGSEGSAKILFTSVPYSTGGFAPIRTADLSTGELALVGGGRIGSYPNIAETLSDGSAFFSGGFSSTSNSYTSITFKVSASGVLTSLASPPVASAGGSGGFISDNEVAFFGSGTGAGAGTRSNASYAYNVQDNTWRQLANCPAGISGAKVIYFGSKAYIIGATSAPGYRTVWEYDVMLDSYTDARWVWPGNTTGVRGVSAARLPSGKYLVLCQATEPGLSGGLATALPKAFVVGPLGPEYEVSLPSMMSSSFAMLAPNGQSGLPVVLVKRAATAAAATAEALSGDGTYLFEENSFGFLSKSSIVYARKLP